MDSSTVSTQARAIGRKLTACLAGVSLTLAASAQADMLDQRTELINKYITEMHADPLVADCAAHGNFVASTSGFDHVDFPPGSFDSGNAVITPWNQPFDSGKQRTTVDNVVTVTGMGSHGDDTPRPLQFRCGYVGTQLLAFSWNDPNPPAAPVAERSSGGRSRHGHAHGRGHAKKGIVKHGKKTVSKKHGVVKKKTAKKTATSSGN
jgi:hypothetical protein